MDALSHDGLAASFDEDDYVLGGAREIEDTTGPILSGHEGRSSKATQKSASLYGRDSLLCLDAGLRSENQLWRERTSKTPRKICRGQIYRLLLRFAES